MKITVKIRSNFGNKAIYPVCEISKGFAAIAKSKTLTDLTISTIKKMGYAVEVEAQRL